jgi:hypothetical protein
MMCLAVGCCMRLRCDLASWLITACCICPCLHPQMLLRLPGLRGAFDARCIACLRAAAVSPTAEAAFCAGAWGCKSLLCEPHLPAVLMDEGLSRAGVGMLLLPLGQELHDLAHGPSAAGCCSAVKGQVSGSYSTVSPPGGMSCMTHAPQGLHTQADAPSATLEVPVPLSRSIALIRRARAHPDA